MKKKCKKIARNKVKIRYQNLNNFLIDLRPIG